VLVLTAAAAARDHGGALRAAAPLLAIVVAACSGGTCAPESDAPAGPSTGAPAASAPVEPDAAAAVALTRPPVRAGGALARGAGEEALYLADEDHQALRRIPLPVRPGALGSTLALPGRPAQVLPLAGRVLVTVRDPGLLLVVAPDGQGALSESARVALPGDAWGVAVTPDERLALVTSAWTHQISAVDLASGRKLWSVDVAREPRGVVVTDGGDTAYVTHLVGAALTRLDGLSSPSPRAASVALPPAPLRAPHGVALPASLGYAAALSPDGARLFVARHALGALGEESWFGGSTVDVLLTATDTPLAIPRRDGLPFLRADRAPDGADLAVPGLPLSPFTQPRAIAYRARARTLLVASEGDGTVVELDALGVDPTRTVLRRYPLGPARVALGPGDGTCGAPTGLALSADESTAWVWCRSTFHLATLPLDEIAPDGAPADPDAKTAAVLARVADDPLDPEAAMGRRLFYDATDRLTSGGLACAGCHPDGRDDGHVWHEAKINTRDGTNLNFLGHEANAPAQDGVRGVARRTPMLAGRVSARGPYGWRGESPTLPARVGASFSLHRWGGVPEHTDEERAARATRLAAFLRRGLVPPPGIGRPLDEQEERGRAVFASAEAGCAGCHVPATDHTDRVAYPMPRVPRRAGFDDEKGEYKTPSLRFVGGRPPYFHDGRAPSLRWIIDNNDDRMGKTNHLSAADRAALVAFLETL
jgi:cytochrome c peroxidase